MFTLFCLYFSLLVVGSGKTEANTVLYNHKIHKMLARKLLYYPNKVKQISSYETCKCKTFMRAYIPDVEVSTWLEIHYPSLDHQPQH